MSHFAEQVSSSRSSSESSVQHNEAVPTEEAATDSQSLAALQSQRCRLLERLMPLAEQPADATSQGVALPLQQFCAELINYLAAGHYYILNNVTGGWSQRALIARTTESAMRFAEQHEHLCEQAGPAPSWQVIRSQLSNLALLLTDRFETEDLLLSGH